MFEDGFVSSLTSQRKFQMGNLKNGLLYFEIIFLSRVVKQRDFNSQIVLTIPNEKEKRIIVKNN